jgi:hypothetical protein
MAALVVRVFALPRDSVDFPDARDFREFDFLFVFDCALVICN